MYLCLFTRKEYEFYCVYSPWIWTVCKYMNPEPYLEMINGPELPLVTIFRSPLYSLSVRLILQ